LKIQINSVFLIYDQPFSFNYSAVQSDEGQMTD